MKKKYFCEKCGADFNTSNECTVHEETCGRADADIVTAVTMTLTANDMKLHVLKRRYGIEKLSRKGRNAYIEWENYDGIPRMNCSEDDGRILSSGIGYIEGDMSEYDAVMRLAVRLNQAAIKRAQHAQWEIKRLEGELAAYNGVMEKTQGMMLLDEAGVAKLVAEADENTSVEKD